MPGILVGGIISNRNMQPYIQVEIDGKIAQLSMAQARSVARQIEVQCARTESDAMIYKFFDDQQYPKGAAQAVMGAFRDFRSKLDEEVVETSETTPPGEDPNA